MPQSQLGSWLSLEKNVSTPSLMESSTLQHVTNYVDQGYPVDTIYLDFQKAFDKVPQRILMKNFRALGIVDEIYNWIEDWLNDRMQRVILLGANLDWITV
jgi:ribonucleases P/MRP protein subunit RPP40